MSFVFAHHWVVVTIRPTMCFNICSLSVTLFEVFSIHEWVIALASTHTYFDSWWIFISRCPVRFLISLRCNRLRVKLLLLRLKVIIGCRGLVDWPSSRCLLLNKVLLDINLKVLRILRRVVVHRWYFKFSYIILLSIFMEFQNLQIQFSNKLF